MIQVEQTILGENGNCFAACVASILELSIEEVPNFTSDDWAEWTKNWQDWLAERNLGLACIHYFEGYSNSCPRGYSILSAKSPRLTEKELNHAVVCFDGEIVFDPHPQREMGVGAWEYFYVFSVLDPKVLKDEKQKG